MISIKENKNGTFEVTQGNKVAENLTYDETLGLVSQLIMPSDRKCLQWLKNPLIQEAIDRGYISAHCIMPAHVDFYPEAAIELPTDKTIVEIGDFIVLCDYKDEVITGENTLSAVIYHNGTWARIIN